MYIQCSCISHFHLYFFIHCTLSIFTFSYSDARLRTNSPSCCSLTPDASCGQHGKMVPKVVQYCPEAEGPKRATFLPITYYHRVFYLRPKCDARLTNGDCIFQMEIKSNWLHSWSLTSLLRVGKSCRDMRHEVNDRATKLRNRSH